MAYTAITAFSDAPSKVGDPDNFGIEALQFLAELSTFRTKANINVTYENALQIDPYNWGIVSVSAPTRVVVSTLSAQPAVIDTGLTFASKADVLLASLKSFVTSANLGGTYIDAMATLSAPSGFVSDTGRPTLTTVSDAPTRNDAPATFDSKAFLFFNAADAYATAFSAMADYVYLRLAAPEDFGLITDSPDEFDDWGTV